jgi:hypothetical protein
MRVGVQKLIIKFDDEVDVHEALLGVQEVILQGRISEQAGKKQYCFHTRFKDGLHISAFKPSDSTDTFVVYKEVNNVK